MITCHLPLRARSVQADRVRALRPALDSAGAQFGGVHHGDLLPSEGASNIALASFSFTLAGGVRVVPDPVLRPDLECKDAFAHGEHRTRCFLSYERTFFRPVFGEAGVPCGVIAPDFVRLGPRDASDPPLAKYVSR